MRVMMAVPSFAREFGGPPAKALALTDSLRALGHEVVLFGAHDAPVAGATVLPIRWQYHGTPVPPLVRLREVARAARQADVVHVIGYRDPVGTAAALGARVAGVPYILEPAGMLRRRLRSRALKQAIDATIGRMVVSGARRLIATSTLEAVEIAEDGVSQDLIIVRPNGIDFAALVPAGPRGGLRDEIGVPSGAPLVLALGRLSRKKGLVPLLEGVAQLPGVHLLIAGPDDGDGTLPELLARRDALGVADRVHVRAGGMWGADRARAFADADVFCLFSLSENFGAAAIEAAYCGVATIVSDQCGAAEWLDDGTVVAPLDRPDLLARALGRLTSDTAERARVAAAGRAAAAEFTWEAVARRQAALYEELVGDRTRH